jgi:hypothetical protein
MNDSQAWSSSLLPNNVTAPLLLLPPLLLLLLLPLRLAAVPLGVLSRCSLHAPLPIISRAVSASAASFVALSRSSSSSLHSTPSWLSRAAVYAIDSIVLVKAAWWVCT